MASEIKTTALLYNNAAELLRTYANSQHCELYQRIKLLHRYLAI